MNCIMIDFRQTLTRIAADYGCATADILPLSHQVRAELAGEFAKNDLTSYPGYISETAQFRADPLRLFPWARSVISVAFPFSSLPDSDYVFPEAESAEFAGKIAGYALKKDYHSAGRKILEEMVRVLKVETKISFRSEICIDTAPVAERIIAKFAGIGIQGKNMNILVPGFGSGCFLAEIFTDLETPELPPAAEIPSPCVSCGRCIRVCPSGALQNDGCFECSRCISHLTMEKRGMLTREEQQILGSWIFGCDQCTSCCPDTILPLPFLIDLKYLLEVPSSELKRAIRGTALEYAGTTLLRRNALAVLGNKNTPATKELIQRFAAKTGSRLLRETAENLLNVY